MPSDVSGAIISFNPMECLLYLYLDAAKIHTGVQNPDITSKKRFVPATLPATVPATMPATVPVQTKYWPIFMLME